MTPHDRGIGALANDPSMLGLAGVTKVETQIPLLDERFWTLTDVDVLYELGRDRVAIVELKTGSGSHWLKAMRQLAIGSQYVLERYGTRPTCFYVHGMPGSFTVLRSEGLDGTFEPVGPPKRPGLANLVKRQFPLFADRLPQASFYGSRG
jgi:hypothetical protein